jgi:branched-chain amino acid transport system permease protein
MTKNITLISAGAVVLLALGIFTDNYIAGLLTQGFTFAILAISVDVLWGLAGILTFGSSAMFGIGAYAVGAYFVHMSLGAWTVPAAIASTIVITGVVSLALGWLVFYSRTKLNEFYVTMVTLGLAVIFQQIAVYGGPLTGGSNGLSGFHVGLLEPRGWYWVSAVALAVTMAAVYTISRSDFGLVLRAIKDHETRCQFIGMNTSLVKTLTFSACNILAALAGCLYALHTTVVAPGLVNFLLATNVVIWVTLGGKGTLLGPVLVAIAINVGSPSLNAAFPLYWQGILGLAFVIAVVALPQGLLPAARSVIARVFRTQAATDRSFLNIAVGESANMNNVDAKRQADEAGTILPFPAVVRHTSDASRGVVLKLDKVEKRYGTFTVIKGISLEVSSGELISIVGPNGAGKTSLIRCISDGIERSAGSVEILGRSIGKLPPDRIVHLGLGRKFQGASVFSGLSVAECILLSSWKGKLPSIWRRSATVSLDTSVAYVISSMNLREVWNERTGDLSHGLRQAVEIAMVLMLKPKLLLLDEPTAGLTEAERQKMGVLFQRLAFQHELSILIIEHDFDFVKEISTRMLVLHDGRILADGTVADVSSSALVRDIYLGQKPEALA